MGRRSVVWGRQGEKTRSDNIIGRNTVTPRNELAQRSQARGLRGPGSSQSIAGAARGVGVCSLRGCRVRRREGERTRAGARARERERDVKRKREKDTKRRWTEFPEQDELAKNWRRNGRVRESERGW